MIDPTTMWVSEYSYQQGCFHVQTLAEALRKNAHAIAIGCPVDYIPFALSPDRDTARDLCNRMTERLAVEEGNPE